jgi:hypothetical protein
VFETGHAGFSDRNQQKQTTETNMKRGNYVRNLALLVSALAPGALMADSISPSSYSTTLGVGESVTIKKTVTVSAGAPTSSKVDVFFLADTTGSMGGQIAAVRAAATSIMNSAALLGDVAFGVGEYKDIFDAYAYRLNTDITSTIATAQAGINLWAASGGGDTPEANVYALQQAANTTSWRAGSVMLLGMTPAMGRRRPARLPPWWRKESLCRHSTTET